MTSADELVLDRTLVALADPTRRRIIERLRSGEARVTDLAAAFPISLNSVSKHIRMLQDAGLLERRVVGREHLLSFRAGPLDAAQRWITAQQQFWASRLQAIEDVLLAEEATSRATHRTQEKRRARNR